MGSTDRENSATGGFTLRVFGDRLTEQIRGHGTPLCCGIDPHLDLIPPLFRRGDMHANAPQTSAAVRDFCFEILGRLRGCLGVIKPQTAFFEVLGAEGMALLADLCREARGLGMLVVMDGKRGDIGSTSAAYAGAFLGEYAAFPADALTVNPFLGMDTLAPFITTADATQSGVFVLLRTSNQGSADIQLLEGQGGKRIYEVIAEYLAPLMEARIGVSGFSSLGVVVGATAPETATALRRHLPHALFLVPGFGAQGAGASDALAGLVQGPEGLEGGIVNASRAILFPPDAQDSRTVTDWRQAIDHSIQTAIKQLRL